MKSLAPVLALLLLTQAALANDVWIETDRMLVGAGEEVPVRLKVGHGERSVELPRKPARLRDLLAHGAAGPVALGGDAGERPLGTLRAQAEGVTWVAYRSQPDWVSHPAQRFEAYLKEEGLDLPLAWRAKNQRSQSPSAEVSSRHLKALLLVGDRRDAPGWERRLGHELEIVPEKSPFVLLPAGAGMEPLPVRVLWRGRPLAKALVKLASLTPYRRVHVLRTDAQGRAVFRMPQPGRWLISAIHMAPAAEFAPWESAWASLACEVPPPDAAAPSGAAVLADVLRRAKASGALKRALGEHHFTFDRTWYHDDGSAARTDRFLMRYTVASPQPRFLTVTSKVQPKGAPEPIVIHYRIGLRDGRVQALSSSFGGGTRISARAVDEFLQVERVHDHFLPEETYEGLDAIVPKVVGVFVLPMLADQGLPERFACRDLNPFGVLGEPMVLRRLRPGEPGAHPTLASWGTEEGNEGITTRATPGEDGRLLELRTESVRVVGGREVTASVALSQRISPERYEELVPTYGGE